MYFKNCVLMALMATGLVGLSQSDRTNLYYLPEVQLGNESDTAFYLVNPGDMATGIDIYGFSMDGTSVNQSTLLTEVAGKSKVLVMASALWPEVIDIHWVQVGSDSELYIVAELLSDGTKSAYWAASSLTESAFMPHVAKNTTTFSTTLSALNGSSEGIFTGLLPRPSGGIKTVPEHSMPYGLAKHDVLDYWSDLDPINWVLLESNAKGLAAMEYFDYIDGNKRRASLGLTNQSGRVLRFLHVATDTVNFWTGMVYINVGDASASVTETYYNSAGTVLNSRQLTLGSNDKVTLLFDANTMDPVPAGTAWVNVAADQNLVGYELFGSVGGNDFFAGLQGSYTSNDVLDYPHYQDSALEWVGYVAVNLGTSSADVTFKLYDASGNQVTETTISDVQPNQKVTRVGGDLFGNAQGAWVRAETTGSKWAGFVLWGDLNEPRVNLSGVNAVQRASESGGSGAPPRVFINEVEENNSYATAQVLLPASGGFNINVIGSLEQSDVGQQLNIHGGPGSPDDVEDVYSFTISEPTALLIATAPDVSITDIDMFVFSTQEADGNWFSADPDFDPEVDYAASAGGHESIARVFQPGTYYIMVSLFEGDTVSRTDYGLLVTQFPMELETFEDQAAVDEYVDFYLVGVSDSDGAAGWAWTQGPVGGKNGAAMSQLGTTGGMNEVSWFVGSELTAPDTGITLIDYQVAIVFNGSFDGNNTSQGLYLYDSATMENTLVNAYNWNANAATTQVSFEGQNLSLLGYLRWVDATSDVFSYSLEAGSALRLAIHATTSDATRHIFDNVRVFNVQTSSSTKKDGKADVMVLPSTRRPKLDQNRVIIEYDKDQ